MGVGVEERGWGGVGGGEGATFVVRFRLFLFHRRASVNASWTARRFKHTEVFVINKKMLRIKLVPVNFRKNKNDVIIHGHFSKFLFFQKSDVTIPDDDKCRPRIFHQ